MRSVVLRKRRARTGIRLIDLESLRAHLDKHVEADFCLATGDPAVPSLLKPAGVFPACLQLTLTAGLPCSHTVSMMNLWSHAELVRLALRSGASPRSMAICRAKRLTAQTCLRVVTHGMRPSGDRSQASMVGSRRAGALTQPGE